MNEGRTDFELLRDFARNGDQLAFTSAVRRHLNLVYGTALRKVEDPGGAQEVTQNVFATLARKAWQFGADDSLPAWLHRTALLEAKMWLRGELRRRRREESAAQLGTIMTALNRNQRFAPSHPCWMKHCSPCVKKIARSCCCVTTKANRCATWAHHWA